MSPWPLIRGFPVAVQVLLVNQFGVNTGFYLLIPYLSGYLGHDLGMSAALVGVVLGVRNLSQQGLFLLGGLVVQVCRTAVYGPQSAMYAELFSTRFRYSGASLAYQIAAILGGGIAPMICTALYRWTGTSMAIAGYPAVLCVISFAASYLLAETYRRRLTDSGVEPATT